MQSRVIAKKISEKNITDNFHLNFQPKFSIEDVKYKGAEVLLRWKDEGEFISPAIFIPIAENTGAILSIGRWVIEETFKLIRKWKSNDKEFGHVAINLSAKQVRDITFPFFLQYCMSKYAVDPTEIELELTESSAMHDVEATQDFLNKIQEIGIPIAIDDFGTGYSSLSRIATMPINTLKLDKAFVSEIGDKKSNEICDIILKLAKSLNLVCVAEGVETEFQFNWLRNRGCDLVQGYYFSKPVSAEDLGKV